MPTNPTAAVKRAGGKPQKRPTALVVMPPCRRRSKLIQPMKSAGIEVLTVPNSEAAKWLLARRLPIQVVLIDVELPHHGWSEVADAVTSNEVNADILLCARHLDADLWQEALHHHVYDFIFTPYSNERVRNRVDEALARERGKPLS